MKKLLIVTLLSLFASSCSEDSFVLKGEILGAKQGEKISLVYPILKNGVVNRKFGGVNEETNTNNIGLLGSIIAITPSKKV